MTKEVFTREQCEHMSPKEKVAAMEKIYEEQIEVSQEVALALTNGMPGAEVLTQLIQNTTTYPYQNMLAIKLEYVALLEKAHNLLGPSVAVKDKSAVYTSEDLVDHVIDFSLRAIDITNRIDEIPHAEPMPT